MSKDKEDFKKECLNTVDFILESVRKQKADPKNAAIAEYLEGYEAGCNVIKTAIENKDTK